MAGSRVRAERGGSGSGCSLRSPIAASAHLAVWSSPVQRALETAAPIAPRARLPVRVETGLTEWLLADAWEGIPGASSRARPGEFEAYLDHAGDLRFSSESLEQLAERVGQTVAQLEELIP